MNPDLDRQPRGVWPYPLDDDATIARKVTGMYRARLRALSVDACDDCDATAVSFGQDWMLNKPQIIDPDRELTTAEVADLLTELWRERVTPHMVRKWACAEHPGQPGEPLLPRFKMRGRERTYLTQHVLAAAATIRRTQLARSGR